MHACKGLEFDTVFIPDVNEGNVPSRRSWRQDQVEEERRLLYVAMTRAKRDLTITFLEGTPDRPAAPSRFLSAFRKSLPESL
jgi:DNA helicase-2/ATP-dependent DNA helicase PcrA